MFPRVLTSSSASSGSGGSSGLGIDRKEPEPKPKDAGPTPVSQAHSALININNGDPYLVVPGRRLVTKRKTFLISQQPRLNQRSKIQGPLSFAQKMLSLKSKSKNSQRQEKADDLSILATIERYRKPHVRRMMSGVSGNRNADPAGQQVSSSPASGFGRSISMSANFSKPLVATPAVASGSTKTSPVFLNISAEKENSPNSLSSVGSSVRYNPYLPEMINRRAESNKAHAKRHFTLSEVPDLVSNSQSKLRIASGGGSPSLLIPPSSPSPSVASVADSRRSLSSTITSLSVLSSKYIRPTLQGSWVGRDLQEARKTSKWSNGLIPDPKVTAQMSIPDLIQIVCGNVPPPPGFFLQPEQQDQQQPANFGINVNPFDNTQPYEIIPAASTPAATTFGNSQMSVGVPSYPGIPGIGNVNIGMSQNESRSRSVTEYEDDPYDRDFAVNLTDQNSFSVFDDLVEANSDASSFPGFSDRSDYFRI